MPIVDEVIEFMKNDLNIKISNKKEKKILNKFYPEIELNYVYWSCSIECSFYEGIITKEEYLKIMELPPDECVNFGEIAKYVYDTAPLKGFYFTDNIDEIKCFYDRGGKKNINYRDLIGDYGLFECFQCDE